MDIHAWLRDLGLDRYAEAFAANDIDEEVLQTLSAEDLEKLGVASLGHRKKLLAAIAALQAGEHLAPTGDPTPAAYTPGHLARRILDARGSLVGERKLVTVLFADLKGSFELIEGADPEDASRILDGAIGAMMAAIHRYEGTVNKVMGDGLMALFGAPIAHEDHAARACYAGLAIQRAMIAEGRNARPSHGVELAARVGLHSGEVVVRAINNDLSIDYDAIGPTVHLASRMEQLAPPGSVCLTSATARLAEGWFEVEPLGALPVKGLSEPVEAFRLQDVTPARTRLDASAIRGLTPLVGREQELSALERARQQVEEGHGQIVALVGEPGVGKSRLLREFLHRREMASCRILHATSVSSGRAASWAPVIELLHAYFGSLRDDDLALRAAKLRDGVRRLDATLEPVLPALLDLLELPSDDPAWRSLDPPQRRRRTLDGIRALLVRESQVQPLVLVLEDLHWVDGETQALLDGLVTSLPSRRMLLLVDYRPEYQHDWTGRSDYTQLRIDPLAAPGAGVLLEHLLGTAPELADLARRLMRRAEGNPLFLEEGVRDLVEAGVLVGKQGARRLSRRPEEIEIPASVTALLAARIDRLSSEEKATIQTAAVIGEDVDLELLEATSDLPAEALAGALGELRARELLDETRLFPNIAYGFRHGLMRQVAYDGLLHETRRRLHRRVAEVLELRYADRLGEVVEALAHHYHLGDAPDLAAEYGFRAALRAKERYIYPLALDLADKVCRITESTADALLPWRQHAYELMGDVHSLLGDVGAANGSYDACLALAGAPDDRRRLESKRHRPGVAIRDGAKIAFYQHGQGQETILFAQAIVYGLEIFQPVVEQLCQEFRVITIDSRGTGRSDPVRRPYLLADHGADVLAVIEEAGGGSITAIGISRGCSLLTILAHRQPQLFRRLVLLGPVPDRMGPDAPIPRLDYAEAAKSFLERGDFEGWARYHYGRVFSEPGTDDILKTWLANTARAPEDTIRSFFDPDPDLDIKPLLPAIRVPTLVMHGVEDRQVTFAAGRYIAERIPGAELYPFEGRGHMPMTTATQEFCEVLRQFVRTGTVEGALRPSLGVADGKEWD